MAEIIAHLTLDTYRKNNIPPLFVPQGDYGARFVHVTVTNQGTAVVVNKSSETVSIVAERSADGESEAFSGEVNDDGSVNVPITQWMLEYEDEVTCHVVITGTDYQYSTTSFLIDPQEKANPTEISEDDPRKDLVTEVLAGEQTRIAAEAVRVAAETARQEAEDARKAAEDERAANEQTRIENETARVEAESQRETKFNGWETAIGRLDSFDSRITRNSKRITNLEQGITPEPFETDSTVSYVKDVPENALPYAEVTKVGGLTRKCTNLYPSGPVGSTTSNGVTFTVNADGTISVSGTATERATFSLYGRAPIKAGRTYTISSGVTNSSSSTYQMWASFSDVNLGNRYNITSGTTITAIEDGYISLYIFVYANNTISETYKPMVNEGTTALPYEPYFEGLRDAKVTELKSVGAVEHSLPVPEAVQALDGYGQGVSEECYTNISWNPDGNVKTFNKVVEKVILDGSSDEDWKESATNSGGVRFQSKQPISPAYKGSTAIPQLICDQYKTVTTGNTWLDKDGITINGNSIEIKDSNYMDVDSFKTRLSENPITVVYEIADYVTTDISDLLPDDNFIEVEGGGTITAVNEYGYDVPTTITYQLKEETA